ncbi:MAG: hypothetical protein FE78DRAFT_87239, partial [Acidomyces sp. 'richmondensis']
TPSAYLPLWLMETAGLVIGGVGLAALFDTCMTAFEYIDASRTYGKDYQKTVLKLATLELRLSRWGSTVKFQDVTVEAFNTATKEQSAQVKALLGQIQMDLEDAEKASKRYTLPQAQDADRVDGSVKLENLTEKLRRIALQRQKKSSLMKKGRWALRDKKKLATLIEDIKDVPELAQQLQAARRKIAVDDTEQLVQAIEVEEAEEPQKPTETVVAILQEATLDVDHLLHDAINIAAKHVTTGDKIKGLTIDGKARVEFGKFIASGYTGPAPAEKTKNRSFDNVKITGDARVRFDDTYGGPGVFDN